MNIQIEVSALEADTSFFISSTLYGGATNSLGRKIGASQMLTPTFLELFFLNSFHFFIFRYNSLRNRMILF